MQRMAAWITALAFASVGCGAASSGRSTDDPMRDSSEGAELGYANGAATGESARSTTPAKGTSGSTAATASGTTGDDAATTDATTDDEADDVDDGEIEIEIETDDDDG